MRSFKCNFGVDEDRGRGGVRGGFWVLSPHFLLTPRHKAHQNIFNEINSRTSIVKTMCRCVLNVINVNLKPTFTIFLHVIVKRETPMVPAFCLSPPLISPYTGHDRWSFKIGPICPVSDSVSDRYDMVRIVWACS